MIDRCGCGVLAIVGELYGEVEVGALDECLHLLKIIAALAADPQLIALNLRAYAPGTLVANELGNTGGGQNPIVWSLQELRRK